MLTTPASSETRYELANRIVDARRQSDALFNVVRADSLYERPIPERHRIVFYIGHLEAFDWNLLGERAFGMKSTQPELDRLFAFGIDPVGGGLPTDVPSDWPSLSVVHDYASKRREALDEKLATGDIDFDSPICDGFPLRTLLHVALEHRLMHIETLSYMLHQLPYERKVLQADPPASPAEPFSVSPMIQIPAGSVTLGLLRDSETFGWDNEFCSHSVSVGAFEIDRYKVTNREYLEFIQDGGYQARSLWSEGGWEWRAQSNISHPVFWRREGDQWCYRGMFEDVPLAPDWPVYVSQAEATAYARWAGKSLPTEAEWQQAAQGTRSDADAQGNFDFRRWNPVAVNAPQERGGSGVHGMVGNGWEWTSTRFEGFPGFEPFPFYRGYSADFFDGRHFVMKGGSARTAASMLRPSFRNWFQPHYQYVYAGFRCVRRVDV